VVSTEDLNGKPVEPSNLTMNKKSKYIYVVSPNALSEASFFTTCESRQLLEVEEYNDGGEEKTDQLRTERNAKREVASGQDANRVQRFFYRLAQYLPTPTGNVA